MKKIKALEKGIENLQKKLKSAKTEGFKESAEQAVHEFIRRHNTNYRGQEIYIQGCEDEWDNSYIIGIIPALNYRTGMHSYLEGKYGGKDPESYDRAKGRVIREAISIINEKLAKD